MASEETKRKIKEHFDLVALVGETVQLRRAGKYFKGLSPFTKEKTPSFFVDPESQSFRCYSSNQGGDVFSFIMLTKGMTFPEALKFLADKAGIPVDEISTKSPEEIAKEKKEKEEMALLFKLNRFAARFFQEQLDGPEGAIARDYVKKRALKPETVLNFAIGYAPDSWTALRDYFMKIKAPLLKAHELGLLRTKGGEKPKEDGSNLFDTFRNRLIFPIRDPGGEVLGFGGRWLGSESADAPKYLNSPESLVYHKSRTLYNLDRARRSIREHETVVLVEGYMDCIALDQAGIAYVVANCGTALTPQHAKLLRGLAPKIISLYDSDAAGQKATERNMELFLDSEGIPILGASLPDGKDPDEFLRVHGEHGILKMKEILVNSPAILDTWAAKIAQSTPPTVQARALAVEKIARHLAKLADDLWIEARIPGMARSLQVEETFLRRALSKFRRSFAEENAPKTVPNIGKMGPQNFTYTAQKTKQLHSQNDRREIGFERKFLSDLLKNPDWMPALREAHAADPGTLLPFVGDAEIKQALTTLLAPLAEDETEFVRVQKLHETVQSLPTLKGVVVEALSKQDDAMPVKDLAAALQRLKEGHVKKRMVELKALVREAERSGDIAARDRHLKELENLRRLQLNSGSA